MPEKDPMSYTIITYAWIIALSSWAAIANYLRKIKRGKSRFSISEVVGEICISGFVGVLTFFLCEASNTPPVLSAAIIGISAHMGSRALFAMETIGESFIKKFIIKRIGRDD